MLEKVRDIFEYFDEDMDGTLTSDDIDRMISLIDTRWLSTAKQKLFAPPCDFIKFLTRIQSPSLQTANILERLESHIRLKIEDVFGVFCEDSQLMHETDIRTMFNFSTKKESDWRTTFNDPCDRSSFVQNWSSLGIFEQRDIFQESEKRIIRRLQDAFNQLDTDGVGLDRASAQKLLNVLAIKEENAHLFPEDKLTFDHFKASVNLLHRSFTRDILPKLERYAKAAVCLNQPSSSPLSIGQSADIVVAVQNPTENVPKPRAQAPKPKNQQQVCERIR